MPYREADGEYRAFIERALCIDRASVQFCECLAEGESDPRSVGMHAVYLIEPVENNAEIPLADPLTVVGDPDHEHSVGIDAVAYIDVTSVGGVLECV